METRYQGTWNASMMADYCWMLKRDCSLETTSRKSKKTKISSRVSYKYGQGNVTQQK